jgi:hypothetical protein
MRVFVLLLAILALSAFVGCQSKPMVVSESGSGSEGIKVHGDWTVEVTNPDGSLATKKQFQNSFLGQHLVAALLSRDFEMARKMQFAIVDAVNIDASLSNDAECMGNLSSFNNGTVPAKAVHTPNADGEMNNSVWNGSCTLEINGDESKFINWVGTILSSTPQIPEDSAGNVNSSLSHKIFFEPIEVWDGQVVAATVILSVE